MHAHTHTATTGKTVRPPPVLTPVNAVPATNHKSGKRYHGAMEMAYKQADMAAMEMKTAEKARQWFSSKT